MIKDLPYLLLNLISLLIMTLLDTLTVRSGPKRLIARSDLPSRRIWNLQSACVLVHITQCHRVLKILAQILYILEIALTEHRIEASNRVLGLDEGLIHKEITIRAIIQTSTVIVLIISKGLRRCS